MERDFQETVSAARSGDADAFESLFARNMKPLMAFIRMKAGPALLNRESVCDLAQSVCREVIEDISAIEYRGDREFRSWLFLQAARKILDRSRYNGAGMRDVSREQPMAGMGRTNDADPAADGILDCYATFCTPTRMLNSKDEVTRIESAIARLPENQRDAIAMSRLLDLSYPEVAAQMEMTESSVRGLVARGLAQLSLELAKEPEA
jgi:RNA polymerase sigma-70 factor, ECF subfamily